MQPALGFGGEQQGLQEERPSHSFDGKKSHTLMRHSIYKKPSRGCGGDAALLLRRYPLQVLEFPEDNTHTLSHSVENKLDKEQRSQAKSDSYFTLPSATALHYHLAWIYEINFSLF